MVILKFDDTGPDKHLKVSKSQVMEIIKEADEMVEICMDGNARIGFISNLFSRGLSNISILSVE